MGVLHWVWTGWRTSPPQLRFRFVVWIALMGEAVLDAVAPRRFGGVDARSDEVGRARHGLLPKMPQTIESVADRWNYVLD